MRPSDSSSTFWAHGVSALAGMVACCGSIWCKRSVTSWAKAEAVMAPTATAEMSNVLNFIMSVSPPLQRDCYTLEPFFIVEAQFSPEDWQSARDG